MSERIITEKNRVVRHGWIELAGHWAIAISGLLLLLSGLFELPMAARYKVTTLPGFGWSGDFILSLYVHYVASVVFIAAAFFHLAYHGLLRDWGLLPRKGDLKASIAVVKSFFGFGEEPPFDKYLPEQRLAYLGTAVIVGVLVLTGLIKTYKNVYAPDLSHTVIFWATTLHNLFFLLFILVFVGHLGAILLKPNRPMVRGIFTGAVRLDYAKHRHPLWLAKIEPTVHRSEKGPEADIPDAVMVPKPVAESGAEAAGDAAEGTAEKAAVTE